MPRALSILDGLRPALRRRRRGAIGVEAVLAFPALLVLFGAVAQVLILAQTRTYVEQAAYAAARSALVHKCPPFSLAGAFGSPFAAVAGFRCTDAPGKWEDAARWALVAASPASDFAPARGACPRIPAALDVIRGTGQTGGFDQAVANALCYAYEPGNVEVRVEWVQGGLSLLQGADSTPLRATVRFRAPLSTPFRRFVMDGKRGDGTYWRWAEATAVLR
jgi:hypothetical protein